MDKSRPIFDYFVIAGLPDDPADLLTCTQERQAPITDICVIFPELGEQAPYGFICIETTPNGYRADLNHGSILTNSCYLCYKRGFDKPPLVDLGVLYEGYGERVNKDSEALTFTPYGRLANVNNGSQGIFITYCRASDNIVASNTLAVTDICIILTNNNEIPPHTYYKICKSLNKGMTGSDVFLCYKKSSFNFHGITYKPVILDRFPSEDHNDYPLPHDVAIFGLPNGVSIECNSVDSQNSSKQLSTFVLTDKKGCKIYGVTISFYEPYKKELTSNQKVKLHNHGKSYSKNKTTEETTYHKNKCLIIVSRFPYVESFQRFLYYLHHMLVEKNYQLPINKYVNLLYELPFPTYMHPHVTMQIGNESIVFDDPESSPLPINAATYCDCLRVLGVKIICVAEALSTSVFPFRWHHLYIPQCPLDFVSVLHIRRRSPFIIGVDSRYFDIYVDPPKDVTCVDLDTNTILKSEFLQKINLAMLPQNAVKVLRQQLEALYIKVMQTEFGSHRRSDQDPFSYRIESQSHNKHHQLEMEIQETFLRFMISLMNGYQKYLKPIRGQMPLTGSTNLECLFDVNNFLHSRDRSTKEFYKHLVATQSFIRFIEDRSFMSDTSDHNAFLAFFFDKCMDKVESCKGRIKDLKLFELQEIRTYLNNSVLSMPSESGNHTFESCHTTSNVKCVNAAKYDNVTYDSVTATIQF